MSISFACHKLIAPLCLLLTMTGFSYADEISDAQETSRSILEKLEQRKFALAWDEDISAWFKEKVTRAAFLGNMTIVHNQLGGASLERKLIQQNQSDGDVSSGYTGKVFSFMYETQFPRARAYETSVLIYEGDNLKLAGFNYVPNNN